MGLFPPNPVSDAFQAARNTLSRDQSLPGFNAPLIPSKAGNGIRSARLGSQREAAHIRNMVRFFVPETGIVEMYINPQNMKYQDKKHLNKTRTRGGYVLQYWGEELGRVNVSGTTGSSGIEGINVLHDIYRNEQVSFDPYALVLANEIDARSSNADIFGDFPPGSLGDAFTSIGQSAASSLSSSFFGLVDNAVENGSLNYTRPKPTLASLAFSIEMYWSGWVFRGFFEDFSVDENSQRIGLFDYNFTFTFTQKRGVRTNFFAWHRSPYDGPSNTDPNFGVPYSIDKLVEEDPLPPIQDPEPVGTNQALTSDRPLIDQTSNQFAPISRQEFENTVIS
jgi:hypothetical protein